MTLKIHQAGNNSFNELPCQTLFFDQKLKRYEMGYALKVPGGLLSMVETAFVCPICERPDDGVEFAEALQKSKRGYLYKKCKGCKRKLFVSCDITGDLFVSEPHDPSNKF